LKEADVPMPSQIYIFVDEANPVPDEMIDNKPWLN
jgi:hypothetical protein